MLNYIWFGMMFIGVVVGALTGKIDEVTVAAIDMAKVAVNLAIGLIGIMALWLGVMKIAEESGLIRIIARGLRPITIRLFPDVSCHRVDSFKYGCQYFRFGQRRHSVRIKSHGRTSGIESNQRYSYQRNVYFFGHKYIQRAVNSPSYCGGTYGSNFQPDFHHHHFCHWNVYLCSSCSCQIFRKKKTIFSFGRR